MNSQLNFLIILVGINYSLLLNNLLFVIRPCQRLLRDRHHLDIEERDIVRSAVTPSEGMSLLLHVGQTRNPCELGVKLLFVVQLELD